MAVQSEIVSAINQICADRGIDPKSVIEAINQSIVTAFKKEYGDDIDIVTEYNELNGTLKAYINKEVVSKATNPRTQISKSVALKLNKKAKLGDRIKVEVSTTEFGRIAAQAAKNVLINNVRDAERNAIFEEIKDKKNKIVTGKVQRMKGKLAIIEVDRATAILPPEEQIPNEYYKINERYKVLIVGVQQIGGINEIIVSRSRPEFLEGLFELEIPEISSGTVKIKGCVREVGIRSKVAVFTDQDGIDPIGSCIGQKGSRINNIMNELGNEKVDIILWDENPEKYISQALSPSNIQKVKVNKRNKSATVEVADDQLSLAIGRDGHNVRLAAKLTGYKISILSPALKGKAVKNDDDITVLNNTTGEVKKMLDAANSENTEDKETQTESNLTKDNIEPKSE